MRVLALALGVGLIAFWAWAFGSGGLARSEEPWPGFRDHELSFAVPDVLVGLTLIVVAAIGVPHPWVAHRLALACAGALAFLGGLDAAYLVRTWSLRSRAMRVRTALVVVVCLSGAGSLFFLTGAMPTEFR